jgi:UPF0755 protein
VPTEDLNTMLLRPSTKRIILVVVFLLFLVGLFLTLGFGYYLTSPTKKGAHDRTFFVQGGSTLSQVAVELEKKEIITKKRLFLLWARLMGYGREIKAGEYKLGPGIPPLKILDILRKGTILTHPVTIPEGFTREQISELLEKKGLADKNEFLLLTGDPAIAKQYGISGPNLEGYLYPDTYHFSRGLSALTIIGVMVNRFREVTDPLRERVKETGMTLKEVIILASIVEKETGLSVERPIIASVFLNRLKKGMRLASDPTVIYGLKDFNGNLTRKDLSLPTPYNTYLIPALPPGPIANPGQQAIKALLYPDKTDYLYFVSKNNGSHYFSKTLSEHSRAVETYQKKRRRRHGKTS